MMNVPICYAHNHGESGRIINDKHLQSQVEGEWKIFKLPPSDPVIEKILHNNPSAEMGKTITFHNGHVLHAKDFLFLDNCSNEKYLIRRKKIGSDEIDPKGSLNAWGPANNNERNLYGPLRNDAITSVVSYCGNRLNSVFEISKGGFLAIYWDEGFYYLKKVSPNKNKQ